MSGVISGVRMARRTSWFYRPLPDFAPVDADWAGESMASWLNGNHAESLAFEDWVSLSPTTGAFAMPFFYATAADPQRSVTNLESETENGIWRIPDDAVPATGTDGQFCVVDMVLKAIIRFTDMVKTTGPPVSWTCNGSSAIYYFNSDGIIANGASEPTTDTLNGVSRQTGWTSYWKSVAARSSESGNRGHRGGHPLMHQVRFDEIRDGRIPNHPFKCALPQRTDTGSGNKRMCHPNQKSVFPYSQAEVSNPGGPFPQGCRFRIKSNAKLIQEGRQTPEQLLTGEAYRLAKALQRYGLVNGDSGGVSSSANLKLEITTVQPAYSGSDMWAGTNLDDPDALAPVPWSTHWEMVQYGYVPPIPGRAGMRRPG